MLVGRRTNKIRVLRSPSTDQFFAARGEKIKSKARARFLKCMYLRSCVLVVEQLLEANEYARRALFDTSDFATMRARERGSAFSRLQLKAPPGKIPLLRCPELPGPILYCPDLPFSAQTYHFLPGSVGVEDVDGF
jgi:hypothetical protein